MLKLRRATVSEAGPGDGPEQELTVELAITQMGTTSIVSDNRIAYDDNTLVQATMVHVTVDRATMTKTPIPDWLREALSPWLVAAGDGARREASERR